LKLQSTAGLIERELIRKMISNVIQVIVTVIQVVANIIKYFENNRRVHFDKVNQYKSIYCIDEGKDYCYCIICNDKVENEDNKFCQSCCGLKAFVLGNKKARKQRDRKMRAGLCILELCRNNATEGAFYCKECLGLCNTDKCYHRCRKGYGMCRQHSGGYMIEWYSNRAK